VTMTVRGATSVAMTIAPVARVVMMTVRVVTSGAMTTVRVVTSAVMTIGPVDLVVMMTVRGATSAATTTAPVGPGVTGTGVGRGSSGVMTGGRLGVRGSGRLCGGFPSPTTSPGWRSTSPCGRSC